MYYHGMTVTGPVRPWERRMLITLLRLNLVVSALLALALLAFPAASLSLQGVGGDAALLVMARLIGGAHLVFALLFWQALRPGQEPLRRALLVSLLVGDGVATAILFAAQVEGVMNAQGWASVVLQAAFALAYGYVWLGRRP